MLLSFKKLSIYCKSKYSIQIFIVAAVCGIFNPVSSQDHYDFNYADRNSLLQAGWDFIAVTPSGGSRNTEQTSGAIISYDQQLHPGVLRIPVDVGELLAGANNSRNTFFRNIPARWTSVRIKISSFTPTQNYQQAGLAVYQDDNNYIQFTRRFDGSNCIKLLKETDGSGSNVNTINLTATTNLHFRLDRDPSTDIISAYYSLNGTSWNYIANTTVSFNNPRLAIVTGSSPGGFPNADIAWAEVNYQDSKSGDELLAYPHELVFNALQGQSLSDKRSVFLSSSLGGIIDWNLSADASWLTSDLQNGTTDGILKIGVNTTGMQSGVHHGNIILESPLPDGNPVIIPVTLIVNPDVPVSITTWKDGRTASMSVSVDDSQPSGFDALQENGFKGTYVLQGVNPPSYYTDYYNAGMELGSHTVNHDCESLSNDVLRTREIEPNISALCTKTPQPCKDVITFVWPCGFTNYREETIASDYFLSSRGYNINKLEDATPENFMNLKSYNSHEHFPYPPSDLKTVVDQAVLQRKWFNLVLHDFSNDDGAITYASSKDIWVAPIGTVVKYILQRERFILTDYNESSTSTTYNVSRLPIPSSAYKNFELAFGPKDSTTMQIDIDDSKTVESVLIGGAVNHYQIKSSNGNLVLLTNVKLEPSTTKTIEVRYINPGTINLTIAGITANNKVYDRTTSAALNTGGASLVGVIAGDNVTLVTSGATGAFSNKNVGTSKTVSCSGFTISGTDASRYSLTQPSTTASISAVSLTISGVTSNNKVYNRTTAATLNTGSATLAGVLTGDNVSLVKSGAIGTFENRNVGTAKTVTTSGFTLGGTDAGNYILTQPTTTGNITPATLTVSGVTANNKVYDGTTTATLNLGTASLVGIFGTDAVNLGSTGVTGTFDNPNTGIGKLVTINGFTISGTDSGNYLLTQPTTIANINGLPLTVSGVTGNNKVYNGTTAATLNTGSATLVGIIGGDIVSLISTGATGTFANKNAGNGKTVTTSGFTLGGSDAAKYTLTQPTTTADISKAGLTVSGVIANNKVYNRTTTATLNTGGANLSGVYAGDVVNLVSTGATGTFSNKNAGTAKSVTTSGFTLAGTDSGNYTLTQPALTANVTLAPLTITGATAYNKVYDRTTSAALNTGNAELTGTISGDIVTLISTGASGTFVNKNAGIARTVTTSGFSLSGTDMSNYSLSQPVLSANITPVVLSITGVTANNKVYNANTSAALNGGSAVLVGILGGDAVNPVFSGASGTFVNKNVATGKVVSASGITLGGADSGNYTLTQPTTVADITPAILTVSGVTTENKVYDGTTSATLNAKNAHLAGIFGSDVVTLISTSATGAFTNKNAGTAKSVTISGFTLGGTDSGNYTLTQPSVTANISLAPLTISGATADNKVYDRTTSAALNTGNAELMGVISGDIVTLISTGASGTFVNKNAGIAKTVATSGFSLSGTDMSNYSLTQPVLSANITPVVLSITGVTANNKVYNANTSAALNGGSAVLVGVLGGDAVYPVFSGASGIFVDKNTGTDKSVSASGIKLGGADSGNYTLTQPATAADITPATLTVSGVTTENKVYDGTTAATLNTENASLVGIFGSDAVTLISVGAQGIFANKDVGSSKPISVSGFSIEGADANNYILTQPSQVAAILVKTLTLTANDLYKAYRTDLTFTGTEYTSEGLVTGDLIPGVTLSSPGAMESASVGTYVIKISGGSNNNYNIIRINGILTVDKALLTATAEDKTKIYGSENPALSITYSGFINGEDESMLDVPPSVQTDAEINSDAGNYTIEVSGGKDNNYNFIYNSGTLVITKADQDIIFEKLPASLRMTQELELIATSSSGLPVSFMASDPRKASLNGNILSVIKDGNVIITGYQEGDHNWNPARDISQSIELLPTFDNISSLFTPNADGMNDYWYIPDIEQYGKIQVTVYNRYGQAVYESVSYNNNWDGTWNGNPLPSASYYYIIRSSERGFLKGVVNIVR